MHYIIRRSINNMIKTLPVDPDPIIKSFPGIGYYLGILNAHGFDTNGLLVNNYVDLRYSRKDLSFLHYFHMQKQMWKKRIHIPLDNVVIHICSLIDQGYYVFPILNEKYVDNKAVHRENDFYHERMVYGYNSKDQIFYTLGYNNRVYAPVEINYENMNIAVIKGAKYRGFFLMKSHICRIKDGYEPEDMDIIKIKKSLKRYISKRFIRFDRFLYFKTNLTLFKYFFKDLKKINKQKILLNTRMLRLFYENKKIILLALQTCNADQYLLNEYDLIIKKCYQLILLSCKYNLDKKEEIPEIIRNLENIIIDEKKIIKEFLKTKN